MPPSNKRKGEEAVGETKKHQPTPEGEADPSPDTRRSEHEGGQQDGKHLENQTHTTAKAKGKGGSSSSPVLDAVIAAIRSLRSHSGSSTKAITNVCAKEHGLDDVDAIKCTIKAAVASGVLTQVKASFLVAGDPPYEDTSEKVVIEDKVVGPDSGRAASRGDTVTIAYKGRLAEGGTQFDAGSNFKFTVGAGDVIKGMDQGVVGMRVGGQRVLHIPPGLGYGKRGSKPDIPPSAALIFDITLKAVS